MDDERDNYLGVDSFTVLLADLTSSSAGGWRWDLKLLRYFFMSIEEGELSDQVSSMRLR